jgi:hypothetical protein
VVRILTESPWNSNTPLPSVATQTARGCHGQERLLIKKGTFMTSSDFIIPESGSILSSLSLLVHIAAAVFKQKDLIYVVVGKTGVHYIALL